MEPDPRCRKKYRRFRFRQIERVRRTNFGSQIPAIASTNAIIAAASCNEAFKIATSSASYLSNYMQVFSTRSLICGVAFIGFTRLLRSYSGTDGIYTHTFEYEKRPECPVCGGEITNVSAPSSQTLEEFIDELKNRKDV